MSGSLISDK